MQLLDFLGRSCRKMTYAYCLATKALALQILLTAATLLECHGQQSPSSPTTQTPQPTHTCRVVLRGLTDPTEGIFSLGEFSLHCWSSGDQVGTTNFTANSANESAVEVRLGSGLIKYLNESAANVNVRGVNWRTTGRPNVDVMKGSRESDNLPPASSDVGSNALGFEDWGIDLLNVPHLKLVDSVVSGVPLSTSGPLLQCLNCSFLTAQNVTLQGLRRPAHLSSTSHFGAVRVTGLRGASLESIHCSEVRGAMGWACVLLQAWSDAAIYIRDSLFDNNAVEGNGWMPRKSSPSGYPSTSFPILQNSASPPSSSVSSYQSSPSAEAPPPGGSSSVSSMYTSIPPASNIFSSIGQLEALPHGVIFCSNPAAYPAGNDPTELGHGAVLIAYFTDDEVCTSDVDHYDATLVIERSAMRQNTGGCGAGVSVKSGVPSGMTPCLPGLVHVHFSLSNSTIESNTAAMDGGGLHYSEFLSLSGMFYMTMSDGSILSSNIAQGQGGGAALFSFNIGYLNVSGSEISYNAAIGSFQSNSGGGGGLYVGTFLDVSAVIISNSRLSHNTAAGFGGAMSANGIAENNVSILRVTGGSTLLNNTAGKDGGALHARLVKLSSFDVEEGSSFIGNMASMNGGAVSICNKQEEIGYMGTVRLSSGSEMSDNHATNGHGGAVYLSASQGGIQSIYVTDATISRNTASCRVIEGCKATGGGISAYSQGSTLPILIVGGRTSFANNTAVCHGGGVFLSSQSSSSPDTSPGISFKGGTFTGNSALTGHGGAIFLNQPGGNMDALELSNSSFINNTGLCHGGALYLELFSNTGAQSSSQGGGQLGSVTITDGSVLAFNSATGRINFMDCPYARESNGGAMYLSVSRIDRPIEIAGGSLIFKNAARDQGGVIFVPGDTHQAGFVISGGSNVSYNTAGDNGGAFLLQNTAQQQQKQKQQQGLQDPVVDINGGSVVSYNYAGSDGGFLLISTRIEGVDIKIAGANVVGNRAKGDGGFIVMRAGDHANVAIVDGSVIAFNSAEGQGGAFSFTLSESFNLEVTGASILYGNQAASNGGVLSVTVGPGDVGDILIDGGSVIANNTAVYGNGGAFAIQALRGIYAVSVNGRSQVDNNTAGGSGGALHIDSPFAPGYIGAISWNGSSTLSNNNASGRGGGIYMSSGSTAQVYVLGASQWDGNTAKADGGALYINTYNLNNVSQLVISGGSQLGRNRAQNGGVMYVRGFAQLNVSDESTMALNSAVYDGGVAFFSQLPFEVRLQSCNVSGNIASRGSGGAFFMATVDLVLSPKSTRPSCVLPLSVSSVYIVNASFAGNTAGGADGGALYFQPHATCGADAGIMLHVNESKFMDNRATGAGGAIALRDASLALSRVTICRSTFKHNTAGAVTGDFTGLASYGGALLIWREPSDAQKNLTASCQLKVVNTSFEANICNGGTGGAVMLISCGSEFWGSTFTANRATLSGGAVGALHLARSSATLGITTVAANMVTEEGQSATFPQERRLLLSDGGIISTPRPRGSTRPNAQNDKVNGGSGLQQQASRRKLGATVLDDCSGVRYRIVNWSTSIMNSNFNQNSADLEYGGALFLYASSVAGRIRITNCNFTRNRAVQQFAGAALLAARGNGTSVLVTGSNFDSNSADTASAGALYTLIGVDACAALVDLSMVRNHAAVSGGAGVLDVRSEGSILLRNLSAGYNHVKSGDGGAILIQVQTNGTASITGCNFTDNIAAGNGGALALEGNCSSHLSLQNAMLARNHAGKSGGAMSVLYGAQAPLLVDGSLFGPSSVPVQQVPANPCPDMSSDVRAQASMQKVEFRNNTAVRHGGAFFLAPASTFTIYNSSMQGNSACRGGGSMAAENCSALTLVGSDLRDSRTSGSGGGLYTFGCRRILLEYTYFSGNQAAVSGGGLSISGRPDDVPMADPQTAFDSISASAADNGFPPDYSSMILHKINASGNRVTRTVDMQGADCQSSVGNEGNEQLGPNGMGGGVTITGKVVGVLSHLDLAQPNYARFGTSIASTQRCYPANTSSSPATAIPKVLNDTYEMQAWHKVWVQLDALAAVQCWILQLSDTLLPPVGAASRLLVAAAETAAETADAGSDQGQVTSDTTAAPQQQILSIWVDDYLASALHARCDPEGGGVAGSSEDANDDVNKTASPPAAPGQLWTSNDGKIIRNVMNRLIETRTQRVYSEEFFAGQVLSLAAANGTISKAADMATDIGSLSQKRFVQLASQLAGCVAFPAPMAYGERQIIIMEWPYIALPSTYMGLRIFDQDSPYTQGLQLETGLTFNITAQLYDMFGQKVTWDVAPSTITMTLRPRPTDGGPYNAEAADGSAPWLDADVANLDPGLNKSLIVSVVNGSATWSGVMVYAWPGLYSLLLVFSTNPHASYVKVAPLEMAVEVLPCQVGDTLDLSRAIYKSSFTGCKTCPSGQYGLWRDERPALTAVKQSKEIIKAAGVNDLTVNRTAYYQWMNDTLSGQDAQCKLCPSNAVCLSGAVIVPVPGYWHSAANSTQLHACPNSAACAVTGDVKIFPTLVNTMGRYSDYRTKLLSWCQLGWYGSNAAPGTEIQHAYLMPIPPTSHEAQFGLSEIPILLNEDIDLSAEITSSASTLPRCLLFGLPSGHPDSYMQQQCAEGYTGNLCAACIPNYYVDSSFTCKRCPSVARTVVLGLISFFSSVVLILFTAITNFSEGFGEGNNSPVQALPGNEAAVADRVDAGDIVKVIVLHIQYLIIVTRLSVEYPSVILQCQAVLGAVTGAENYVMYSPSCLVPDKDSAGQALIQWLASILTPCAVAVVSMMLWTLRYAIPLRKAARLQACAKLAQSLRAASFRTRKAAAAWLAHSSKRSAGFPRIRHCCSNLDGIPTTSATPDHIAANANPPAPGATPFPCPMGSLGICNVFKDVQIVAFDSEYFLSNPKDPADLNASTTASPTTCTSTDAPPLPVDLAASARAAALTYFNRHQAEAIGLKKTPKTTLSTVGSAALSDAMKTLSRLRTLAVNTQQSSQATFVEVDKAMSLREQLGVVLMAAVFILYPSWAQAALSTFACYPIDDGEGPFSEAQQATWKYGYWVRNMQAMCYSGNHLRVYVPIGVAAVLVFCLLPPLMSFWFVWRVRGRLNDTHVRKVYGFLYKRYKPRFIWWETVLQLETLILVTVEVLGRGLNVSYQALLLLVVFTVIALINVSCAPLLSRMLVLMEFISLGTLSLTITLSLYFTIDGGLNPMAENVLAILIITLNTSLIGFFLVVASRHLWPAIISAKFVPTVQSMMQKLSNLAASSAGNRPLQTGEDMEADASGADGGDQQRRSCWPILKRLSIAWQIKSDGAPLNMGRAASTNDNRGAASGQYRLEDLVIDETTSNGTLGSGAESSGSVAQRISPGAQGLDVGHGVTRLACMATCRNTTPSKVCIRLGGTA
ncbi:hypothetical protein VaNZ11_005318 [Volvox africanus]|uniref:Uncharacterized protein n=1 Tax=Volvox africanus TaxID=51714 RepID=A0ABQ5RYI7_9CHLO|nr:hypothetical protein VaNZ11_005318 [Volvox africanus]